MEDFRSLLFLGAKKLGLSLEKEVLERLDAHRFLLLKWAKKINLTTVLTTESMVDRLYLDSLVVAGYITPKSTLHDVGSGAGFPGLILKAFHPELSLRLSEARRKKCSFLRQAAYQMGLLDTEITWTRVGWEEDKTKEGHWNEVISRAVFPPLIWIQRGAPLLKEGGRLWVMSGQPIGEGDALVDWNKVGLPNGLFLERLIHYRLPFCKLERTLVALRKEK
jgi:16S rRNA (guanine527-N7)-methyltransferase